MMINSPDAPPVMGFWSWKKIMGFFLVSILFLFGLLLGWDSKREAFPELARHPVNMPPAADNGYLELKERWSKLPMVDPKILGKWRQLEAGQGAWDSDFVRNLNPGGHDLRAYLARALAAPAWMVPVRGADNDREFSMLGGVNALRASAIQGLLDGRGDQALDLVEQLRLLSRRQIKGAKDGYGLFAGCLADLFASTLTAQLLVMTPVDAQALERLRICWEDDGISQADLGPAAAGEMVFFDSYSQGAADRIYLEGWRRWHFKLTYRRNWTRNRMGRLLSAISLGALATAPARESTLYAELDRVREDMGEYPYLDLLSGGKLLTSVTFTAFFYGRDAFLTWPRQKLFAARAARVAVALKRWGRSHGDGMPATLDELVPEFLSAIPADPWNGQPIQWEPASRVLAAVGEDWLLDGATAGEFGFSGLGGAAFGRARFSLSRANTAPLPSTPVPAAMPKKR